MPGQEGVPVPGLSGPAQAARTESERQQALQALLSPQQPEVQQPISEQGEWGLPAPGVTQQSPEEEPLFGELPGEGYLYPHAIDVRLRAMVQTNPEAVRMALLRAIEVAATAAQLPFSENKPSEYGHMALMMSQAYLLLDPSVDQHGVPVDKEEEHVEGHQGEESSTAPGGSSAPKKTGGGGAGSQPKSITTGGEKGHQTFKRAVTRHGHVEPPRVQMNPAEEAIKKKHEEQEEDLRGARGDIPRPQPRVGSL
jgi:hypothetical protein